MLALEVGLAQSAQSILAILAAWGLARAEYLRTKRQARRCGTAEIMRRSGKSKPVVGTWQARFMAEGVEGLMRDKTRKPGKPPLPPTTVQRVVDLALSYYLR
jgi:hypothetical protein